MSVSTRLKMTEFISPVNMFSLSFCFTFYFLNAHNSKLLISLVASNIWAEFFLALPGIP